MKSIRGHKTPKNKILQRKLKKGDSFKIRLQGWSVQLLDLHGFPSPLQGGNFNTSINDVLVESNVAKVSLWINNLRLRQHIFFNFKSRPLLLLFYKLDVSLQFGDPPKKVSIGLFKLGYLDLRFA